jgi:hypothetical protein
VQLDLAVPYAKRNFDNGIKCVNFLTSVVTRSVEREAIGTGGQILAFGQQLTAPAVAIRPLRCQQAPTRRLLPLNPHGHIVRRLTESEIENMCGDTFHS